MLAQLSAIRIEIDQDVATVLNCALICWAVCFTKALRMLIERIRHL